MEICEPCQVGNEAALSRTFHVTWGFRGLNDIQSQVLLYLNFLFAVIVRGCDNKIEGEKGNGKGYSRYVSELKVSE